MPENPYGIPLISDPKQDIDDLELQLDLYEKGRRLRNLVRHPDWELVVQILEDYRDKARDALIALPPADPNVLLAHAAASATNDVFTCFNSDIAQAVHQADHPSDELKAKLYGVRKALDVTVAMGER